MNVRPSNVSKMCITSPIIFHTKVLSLCVLYSFFFLSSSLVAAVPMVESLFKNPSNADIKGSTVVIKMKLNELLENNVEGALGDVSEEKKVHNLYVKIIFFIEENKISALQTTYPNKEMKRKDLTSLYYEANLLDRMNYFNKFRTSINDEKWLFYSVLSSLGLNSSQGIVLFLENKTHRFIKNENLVNKEKKKLLEKYTEYLGMIKEDKSLAQVLPDPINPEDPEKLTKVKALLAQPFYRPAADVKLIYQNKRYFWHVNLDEVQAYFTNNKKQLSHFLYHTDSKQLELKFFDYILYNGIHELPKTMTYKIFNNKEYIIEMLGLRHFTEPIKTYRRRVENYRKIFSKKKKVDQENSLALPSFLLI